eukprot:GGOE01041171.1.p3 GENE.GGOE01041171.1~~GGOE01041171.1.p3  ORF type:complete len:184 (-),score=24.41 GGOE01041171.1:613-1164(-)
MSLSHACEPMVVSLLAGTQPHLLYSNGRIYYDDAVHATSPSRWVRYVVAPCCLLAVLTTLMLSDAAPNLWASSASPPLRPVVISSLGPWGWGPSLATHPTRNTSVRRSAEAAEVPDTALPPSAPSASSSIPLLWRTAAEVAAELEHPPTPQQDRLQVAQLSAQHRAKFSIPVPATSTMARRTS